MTYLVRPTRAVAVGGALVALVLVAGAVVPTGPLEVDARWAEAMRDIRGPLLDHVALVFNAFGRGLGWVLGVGAVGVVLALGRRWRALAVFAVVEIAASLGSTFLKAVVGRPRPPGGLVHPVGSSFPSGHATYAGATCVALVLLFTPAGRRGLWWLLAAAGIAGMAWSRTYLQVHWLSDVVAGAALGVGVALLGFGVAQLTRSGSVHERGLP